MTKLRGDVHSLEEIAEEEKEEEDVTMVEEESVQVSRSKKKNKKRKLDTSEELPGKACLFNRGMSLEEEWFLAFYVLYRILLRLWHWQSDALTTRLDLIHNWAGYILLRLDLIPNSARSHTLRLDLIHESWAFCRKVVKFMSGQCYFIFLFLSGYGIQQKFGIRLDPDP